MPISPMFSHLPEIEAHIQNLVDEHRYDDALANIVVGVHNHYKLPQVAHKQLYYPVFDRQIEALTATLAAANPPSGPASEPSRNTLVIATELYPVGGHSKVVEDLMHELESPTLVLTDMFGSYRKEPLHLLRLFELFGEASLIVLPQPSMWARCRALLKLVQRLNPQAIFHLNHHQDPIGLIGSGSHAGSRKTLVHHSDHNPSLGCTLPGLTHLDFSDELAAICSRELHTPTSILPLYVPDGGLKNFAPVEGNKFSIVTSGTHVKFTRTGELALHKIVQTVLTCTSGDFIHIGPMDKGWQAEVRNHLQVHQIDPDRFRPLGAVPSLWESMLALDAHVYLGSAPVGGGRAALEAQGCGYPLVFHRGADRESLIAVESIYAEKALGWTTLGELAQLMSSVGSTLPQLSAQSRAFYERFFSRAQFRRVLGNVAHLTA